MTVLASNLSPAAARVSLAASGSDPSTSISKTLPCRTEAIPLTPSECRAPSIALPCGSSTPVFKVTVTRAFISGTILFSGFLKSLHQLGAAGMRFLVFLHDAEAAGDFGISFDEAAEIAAEPVLVQLVIGLDVPQAAGIRRDFVCDDNAHHVAFPKPTAFHLEIDQTDADAEEQAGEEIIDADRQRHDVVDFLRGCPAESGDMLFRNHRIVERIVLVIEFDDRAGQLRAFLDAEARRKRAGGD